MKVMNKAVFVTSLLRVLMCVNQQCLSRPQAGWAHKDKLDPDLASRRSDLGMQIVLQDSKDSRVCSGKPSGFGGPKEGLDLIQDIKEGFLKEVTATGRQGGGASFMHRR